MAGMGTGTYVLHARFLFTVIRFCRARDVFGMVNGLRLCSAEQFRILLAKEAF